MISIGPNSPSFCRIAGVLPHSFNNGTGTRFVIFFQGCPHDCPGCQNPDTHDFGGGLKVDISALETYIFTERKLIDGITFSGGEPLLYPDACIRLASFAHSLGKDVWCYTGYTYEELLDGRAGEMALRVTDCADVLVDGPFIEALKSDTYPYAGSTNQRVLSMKSRFEIAFQRR